MNNPTDAEVKEFWEWCGFKQLDKGKRAFHYEQGQRVMDWMPPDKQDWFYSVRSLPFIDLNNLFKYAVPKLNGWNLLQKDSTKTCVSAIRIGDKRSGLVTNDDPALALFWAIWEVIK